MTDAPTKRMMTRAAIEHELDGLKRLQTTFDTDYIGGAIYALEYVLDPARNKAEGLALSMIPPRP